MVVIVSLVAVIAAPFSSAFLRSRLAALLKRSEPLSALRLALSPMPLSSWWFVLHKLAPAQIQMNWHLSSNTYVRIPVSSCLEIGVIHELLW